MLNIPCVRKAGIDEFLIDREGRIQSVAGDDVEIADEHDGQGRVSSTVDHVVGLWGLYRVELFQVGVRKPEFAAVLLDIHGDPATRVRQRDSRSRREGPIDQKLLYLD